MVNQAAVNECISKVMSLNVTLIASSEFFTVCQNLGPWAREYFTFENPEMKVIIMLLAIIAVVLIRLSMNAVSMLKRNPIFRLINQISNL